VWRGVDRDRLCDCRVRDLAAPVAGM